MLPCMLSDLAERRGKKATANQTKHILHGMFKWAKQPGRKFVTVNPFADLPAPGGCQGHRDRFLTADKIRRVWQALDDAGMFNVSPDAATALRLILITAARPGMVRGHDRGELYNLRGQVSMARMVAARRAHEGRRAFITPLSALALELLRPHLKADPTEQLFNLRRHDLHERRSGSLRLGMERWTPHDLSAPPRRSSTGQGYSLEQIGALLAHTRKASRRSTQGGTSSACGARWRPSSTSRCAKHWMASRRAIERRLAPHPRGGADGRSTTRRVMNITTADCCACVRALTRSQDHRDDQHQARGTTPSLWQAMWYLARMSRLCPAIVVKRAQAKPPTVRPVPVRMSERGRWRGHGK